MLELDDCRHRVLAHVFDRVLVAEPVGPLDRVVHVPAPIVLAHIAEGSTDAALGGDGVAAGREYLAETGGLQTGCGHAEGRAQPGTAPADHDDVIAVVVDRISLGHDQPPFVFSESGGGPILGAISIRRSLASRNLKAGTG